MENVNFRLKEIIKLAVSIKDSAERLMFDCNNVETEEQIEKRCSEIEVNAYHISSIARAVKQEAS